jgi:hypothetical protein
MAKKTVGYIVVDDHYATMQMCVIGSSLLKPSGVKKSLFFGGRVATMFPDLRAARKALKDSERVAVANSLQNYWNVKDWRIVRLVEP